jgi:hypothetical protein
MDTASDEIFFSLPQRNALAIDDQGVAAINDDHVFVVFVNVRCGFCRLRTGPKGHLAAVDTIKDVAIDSWRCLIRAGDSICRMLQERGEFDHGELFSHSTAAVPREATLCFRHAFRSGCATAALV